MNLGRRGFLKTLAAAAASVAAYEVIDPERLLWVPGQKTIFLPPETRLVQPELIVDPSAYVGHIRRGYREAVDDIELDLTEATYLSNLQRGATFAGFKSVNIIGANGAVRQHDQLTARDLDAMRIRLLAVDAKRAGERDIFGDAFRKLKVEG